MPKTAAAAAKVAAGPSTEFVLEEFLPYQLAVTAARLTRVFARQYHEEVGVSVPEFRVLTVVGRNAGISPSAVGERAMMDKVKVSRAAAALVSRGLLKQSPHPTDGRARMLKLTKKGESLLTTLVPLAEDIENRFAAQMGKGGWASLRQALEKLNALIPHDETHMAED
jgi:DNA-binding MarR family transcriptional regulator